MTYRKIAGIISVIAVLWVGAWRVGSAGAAVLDNVQYHMLSELVNEVAPSNGTTQFVAEPNGQSFTITDKVFSDFSLFSVAQGGALAVDPDAVLITAGTSPVTGEHVLDLSFGLGAMTGQSADLKLAFKVSILPPAQTNGQQFIFKDFGLRMNGTAVTGNGLAQIGEDVYSSNPFGTGSLADLTVQTDLLNLIVASSDWVAGLQVNETATTANPSDHVVLPDAGTQNLTEVWVLKDIFVSGDEGGTAHISDVVQSFSQAIGSNVPEPASLVLAIGAAGVLAGRRRRRPV